VLRNSLGNHEYSKEDWASILSITQLIQVLLYPDKDKTLVDYQNGSIRDQNPFRS
jgi:hypothetical protein